MYQDGFIYKDYDTSESVIGIPESYYEKYSVSGPHNFKDGEDVTGRYELKFEHWEGSEWLPAGSVKPRRIAIPIASQATPPPVTEEEQKYSENDIIKAMLNLGYSFIDREEFIETITQDSPKVATVDELKEQE